MATTSVVEVVMPQMGVSVSEGTITKWLKNVGDPVEADESLLEISTDKVDTEVPSPGSGVLQEILVQEGETVEVGTKLATIGPAGGAAADPPEPAPAPPTEQAARASEAPSSAETPAPATATAQPTQDDGATNGKTFVSPVVAKIASEHGVDPGQVPGTGRGGRVTKKDILAFIEGGGAEAPAQPEAPSQPATPPAPQPQAEAPPAPRPQPQPAVAQAGESLEPMNAMRRGIADHMRRSLDTAAHVTSAIEVDMSKVVAIRSKLK